MKLPKINYEDLPEEVKGNFTEDEIEFDSVVDEDYAVDFPVSSERYRSERIASARKAILQKKYVEEITSIEKRFDRGKITEEKALTLLREATDRRDQVDRS